MSAPNYHPQGFYPCFVLDQQGQWVPAMVPFNVPTAPIYAPQAGPMVSPTPAPNYNMPLDPAFFPPTPMPQPQQTVGTYHMQPHTPATVDSPARDAIDLWVEEEVRKMETELQLANANRARHLELHAMAEARLAAKPVPQSNYLPSPATTTDEISSPYSSAVDSSFTCDPRQVYTASPSGGCSSPETTASPPTTTRPSAAPNASPVFFCPDPSCFVTFTNPAALKKHERKHKQQFHCPLCRKGHLDKRAVDRHLWTRHEEYARKHDIKSERIRCRECDYESRSDNVRRHEKSQHGLDRK